MNKIYSLCGVYLNYQKEVDNPQPQHTRDQVTSKLVSQ